MSSSNATPVDPDWPAVDDHLLEPGPFELYDGELVYVAPANDPHGFLHAQVSALVEAHAGPEFRVACDLLTRVSRTSEVAPDVSVMPRAKDPRTGGRQLEQLVFEVASTESLGHVARKAQLLTARGVRRVFVIDVERARALEWSAALETWSMLDPSASIEDPALAAPLPIQTLIQVANSDDAVARALLIKRNPVLEAALEQRSARSRAEALLVLLGARGISPGVAERTRILDEKDLARLDRWIARAATCPDAAALLAEP